MSHEKLFLTFITLSYYTYKCIIIIKILFFIIHIDNISSKNSSFLKKKLNFNVDTR